MSNEEVLKRASLPSIESIFLKVQLRWADHVTRMEDVRVPKAVFFSIMLREAKEDLPDGIYIRFRTDGSLFSLRRLLASTKTIEELIIKLLFADDCALLARTEEALQHIVNRFCDAAKNFGLSHHQPEEDWGVVPDPSTRGIQSSSHQHQWHQPKCSGTLHLPA